MMQGPFGNALTFEPVCTCGARVKAFGVIADGWSAVDSRFDLERCSLTGAVDAGAEVEGRATNDLTSECGG